MKAFAVCLLTIALIALVNARWTTYCDDRTCPNTITDITPVRLPNGDWAACLVGGYSSSPDPDEQMGIWCADKGDLSDLKRLQHFNSSLMFVALASSEQGPIVSTGIGIGNNTHLMHSFDHKNAFNSQASIGAYGQDVKSISTGFPRSETEQLFAAVGTMDVFYGGQALFLSEDSGKTFVNRTWDPTITYGDARYTHGFASNIASQNVIYVSGGTWPGSSSRVQEHEDIMNRCIRLSQHVCTPAQPNMSFADIQKTNARVYSQRNRLNAPSRNGGYAGLITKTHDAGKTWTKLFETDEFYFNDIHCVDADRCIVVGENASEAYIYQTSNAGVTWTQRLKLESTVLVSLFRARFVSPQLAYVVGGWYNDETELFEGLIYKSTDGGVTWNIDTTVPDVAIIMGLNFNQSGDVGYAVGTTQSSLSIVVRYDRY